MKKIPVLLSTFPEYFPNEWQDVDMLNGFRSFYWTFSENDFSVVLKNVLLDVHNEIEKQTNPLSEDNKDTFNANVEKIKTDTVIGSAYEIKDGVNNLYNNIANSKATAYISVNTLPVTFFDVSIPSHSIKIDFSWFAPYRDFTLSLWRFILWIGYIYILFKRLPDIINGAGMVSEGKDDFDVNLEKYRENHRKE